MKVVIGEGRGRSVLAGIECRRAGRGQRVRDCRDEEVVEVLLGDERGWLGASKAEDELWKAGYLSERRCRRGGENIKSEWERKIQKENVG